MARTAMQDAAAQGATTTHDATVTVEDFCVLCREAGENTIAMATAALDEMAYGPGPHPVCAECLAALAGRA